MQQQNRGIIGWAMMVVFAIFLIPYGRNVLAKRYVDFNGLVVVFVDTCYEILTRTPKQEAPPAPQSQPDPSGLQ